MPSQTLKNAIIGSILGTAIADAIGLPYEGLGRDRQQLLYPEITNHNLIFQRGLISDDTEHTCLVAQSLIISTGNVTVFQRDLAGRLQFWLLGLPAGIGFATLRAILKLWLGFPPKHSGVFSAGNGPAMRSPLLGVCFGHQPDRLKELPNGVSGYIYHTVPVVLQTWFRHPQDYRTAILEIIQCGGDTDTTAAILGGIIGADVGKAGIPKPWITGMIDYPRSVKWMEKLGDRLLCALDGDLHPILPINVPLLFLRNLVFIAIVLYHGFRRLFPPYVKKPKS
jgi:ADP-ribosylglycohydrolase